MARSSFCTAFLLAFAALSATGCGQTLDAAPASSYVPPDPRVQVFRKAVRVFSEEARVATNRFELGMSLSEAEIVLDDLKALCSRIPEAPLPEFQTQREDCIALVKQYERAMWEVAGLDATRRRTEQLARLEAARNGPSEVLTPDWIPWEERGTGVSPALVELHQQKAQAVQHAVADLRVQTRQLKESAIPPGLAERDLAPIESPTFTR